MSAPRTRLPRARKRLACYGFAILTAAAALVANAAPAAAEPCRTGELVVARGTEEPGHLGAAVGDPLHARLAASAGPPIGAYRVAYPADLRDPNSVPAGVRDVVAHLREAGNRCPAQRYVLVGYSQGALVMHGVLGSAAGLPGMPGLTPDLQARIAAVLLFGDAATALGLTVPGPHLVHTRTFCAAGDPLCAPGGTDLAAHAAYGDAIAEAALFIRQVL